MHQSVLVTGASSGIGEATAVHLAHKGFRVFAAARRIEKLNALKALGGGKITPVALDVTDDASIKTALAEIENAGAVLYGLVNNAGVSVMGPVELVSSDEWRRQFETNVFGLVAVTRAVLPQMRGAGRGRIVNIGSIAGRIAAPFQGVYASSKHAVEGLSDSLRRELAPHGVKVSVVRPGFINTPFGHQEQEALERFENEGPYADQVKTFKAWHARGHPSAPGPSVVAEAVHNALTAQRPHSRYTAPPKMLGALAMRNLFPSAVTDRIFERVNGLNAHRKEEN
ncbi:SDR family oxidoreductase [Hyphococcus sp.]|uniref:SDR family oxidoreductase n=1 Tax=Hyphococcus sp. TaxID=2038636 RepID=UPI003CCBB907